MIAELQRSFCFLEVNVNADVDRKGSCCPSTFARCSRLRADKAERYSRCSLGTSTSEVRLSSTDRVGQTRRRREGDRRNQECTSPMKATPQQSRELAWRGWQEPWRIILGAHGRPTYSTGESLMAAAYDRNDRIYLPLGLELRAA
jgi:hypothetical protein